MDKQIVLGFDYGLKRIGMAIGQSITGTAAPLETLNVYAEKIDWPSCDRLFNSWKPTHLVVGLPIPERNIDQTLLKAARELAVTLAKRYARPVYGVDESFTTRMARQYLQERHGKSANHLKVDGIAACLIVESFLREGGVALADVTDH